MLLPAVLRFVAGDFPVEVDGIPDEPTRGEERRGEEGKRKEGRGKKGREGYHNL